MVLIKYALLITQVLLYALQGTIWSLREVSFPYMTFQFDVIYGEYKIYLQLLTSFPLRVPESLRYLSMYDNRCLRYFKGHKQRFEHVFLMNEILPCKSAFA